MQRRRWEGHTFEALRFRIDESALRTLRLWFGVTRSERVGGGAGVGSGDTESKREGG